jgi:hypothetical protein
MPHDATSGFRAGSERPNIAAMVCVESIGDQNLDGFTKYFLGRIAENCFCCVIEKQMRPFASVLTTPSPINSRTCDPDAAAAGWF